MELEGVQEDLKRVCHRGWCKSRNFPTTTTITAHAYTFVPVHFCALLQYAPNFVPLKGAKRQETPPPAAKQLDE
jgi:hypothetical protein